MFNYFIGLETKDQLTLIGILFTFILTFYSTFFRGKISRNKNFIDTIASERVIWVNTLREKFSDFNNLAYIEYSKLQSGSESDYNTVKNLIHIGNNIELFLNPTEPVTEELIKCKNNISLGLLRKTTSFEEYEKNANILHYLQQVILKSEWRRIKVETKKGKEIKKIKMLKIFQTVAESINKNRYNDVLKAKLFKKIMEERKYKILKIFKSK